MGMSLSVLYMYLRHVSSGILHSPEIHRNLPESRSAFDKGSVSTSSVVIESTFPNHFQPTQELSQYYYPSEHTQKPTVSWTFEEHAKEDHL